MNWLHYLVEANIYLGVFYLCYYLFLKTETHYTLSRAYLLFTCVISFVLPIMQLSLLKPVEQVVPEIEIVEPLVLIHNSRVPVTADTAWHFNLQDALLYAYIAGVIITLIILGYRLLCLSKLARGRVLENNGNYKLISLKDENTAFSFFNYLFLGTNVAQSKTVIAHELVHIRQKHSADIMFIELIKVISWFNPFIYLLQHSLKTIHEYVADEQTAAQERDALTYSSFLLDNAYGIQGTTIAHSFFNYNLLKKRIIMLNKQRSGRLARLKYLAVVPLCGGMLCASTLAFSKDYGFVDLSPKAKITTPVSREASVKPDTLPAKVKVDNSKRLRNAMSIPPPPPPLPLVKPKRPAIAEIEIVPPPAPRKIKRVQPKVAEIEIDEPLPAPPAMLQGQPKLPPPPPPFNSVYKDLINFVAKHIRYPAAAHDNKVNGNVLISLRLDNDHKITNVTVVNGIGYGCDQEVVRALKDYTGTVDQAPGAYQLMVSFALLSEDRKRSYAPDPIKPDIVQQNNFIGQARYLGMLNNYACM